MQFILMAKYLFLAQTTRTFGVRSFYYFFFFLFRLTLCCGVGVFSLQEEWEAILLTVSEIEQNFVLNRSAFFVLHFDPFLHKIN